MVEMGNKLIDLTNLTNSKTTDIQEKVIYLILIFHMFRYFINILF